MRWNNASMGLPAVQSKQAGAPHRHSLLPGRLVVILGMLALAGCASAPLAPLRVEVPVSVPCVGTAPSLPAYEFDKLPTTATDGEIILALAQDWARARKHEGELLAIVAGCLVKR